MSWAYGVFVFVEVGKGSLLLDIKVKSFQQRWMGAGGLQEGDTGGDASACDENSIIIERDTLILLNCKRGGMSSIKNIGYSVHSPSITINGMLAWIKLSLLGRRLQKVCASCLG